MFKVHFPYKCEGDKTRARLRNFEIAGAFLRIQITNYLFTHWHTASPPAHALKTFFLSRFLKFQFIILYCKLFWMFQQWRVVWTCVAPQNVRARIIESMLIDIPADFAAFNLKFVQESYFLGVGGLGCIHIHQVRQRLEFLEFWSMRGKYSRLQNLSTILFWLFLLLLFLRICNVSKIFKLELCLTEII